jgi:hypothetical protein
MCYTYSTVYKMLLTRCCNSYTQVPFQWSKTNLTDVHEGQPDLFDFQFELITM